MAEAGGQAGMCSCITDSSFKTASNILRICNLLNAGLVIFAGVYSMIGLLTFHLVTAAVSTYLIIFGCLLCCFEVRIGYFEKIVRKRFGFMFTYLGRTLFLLFVASLCFAQDSTASFAVGGVTIANAFLNMFVMWHHGEAFADPTGKYATAEDHASNYIQNNPELAQRAIGAGVSYARENPQLAQAGAQAGANYVRNNPEAARSMAQSAMQNNNNNASNPFSITTQ